MIMILLLCGAIAFIAPLAAERLERWLGHRHRCIWPGFWRSAGCAGGAVRV
jgi:hypothetical protein